MTAERSTTTSGGASGGDLNYGCNDGGSGGAADEFGYICLILDSNNGVVQQTGARW